MQVQFIPTDEGLNREGFRNYREAPAKMGDLSIEEVNDIEEFRSLKESWDALLRESCDNNIFLTWEWLFTWWQHYGSGKKLRIFLVKESGRIIAIAPFMESKYRKGILSIDVLENICGENCDYSGVILTERKHESIAILLDYLGKIFRDGKIVARMWHIPDNSSFITLLRDQYPLFSQSLFLSERQVTSCLYIDLPATWDEYLRNIERRHNLKRNIKSLEKTHKIEFKNYACGEDLRDRLQVLFELHQKRWQDRDIVSKFTKPEAREFYVDVSKAFHENKWLDFSFLNVDGKPVSVHWGFIYNNIYHFMTPAFDISYSRYGVGRIHLSKLIEDAIKHGLKKFDFLKGAGDYKFEWTRCAIDNIQITMAKKGFGGRYQLKLLQILPKIHIIGPRSLRYRWHAYLERRQHQKRGD